MPLPKLTKLELQIMNALWNSRGASIREIQDSFPERDRRAYTGILKVCDFYLESPRACAAGVTGANLKKRIEAIMTQRMTRNLDLRRKLLIGTAGVLAIVAPVVFGMLHATPSRAGYRPQDAAAGPGYESDSIKPSNAGASLARLMFSPTGVVGTNISLTGNYL